MNILVAVLLSLVTPGAGQAYNGQYKMAWVYALIDVLSPILLLLLYLVTNSMAVLAAGGMSRGIIALISIVDAGGRAYEKNKGTAKLDGPGGWQPGLICFAGVISARMIIGMAAAMLAVALGITRGVAGS